MEIVPRTETPEGIGVVLPAVVYANVLEAQAAVADLALIDRTAVRLMLTGQSASIKRDASPI